MTLLSCIIMALLSFVAASQAIAETYKRDSFLRIFLIWNLACLVSVLMSFKIYQRVNEDPATILDVGSESLFLTLAISYLYHTILDNFCKDTKKGWRIIATLYFVTFVLLFLNYLKRRVLPPTDREPIDALANLRWTLAFRSRTVIYSLEQLTSWALIVSPCFVTSPKNRPFRFDRLLSRRLFDVVFIRDDYILFVSKIK